MLTNEQLITNLLQHWLRTPLRGWHIALCGYLVAGALLLITAGLILIGGV